MNSLSNDLRRQLGRWRILELVGEKNFPWTDNALPLLHQRQLDSKGVIEYIGSVVRSGRNMPEMSPRLARTTNQSLCELFLNIFEHADSPVGGLAIGQYYPKVKEIQFNVCDVGVGLVRKVRKSVGMGWTAKQALFWALQEGNSTKRQPGGLGLHLLREFVKVNGGTFRILANDGYYELGEASENYSVIATPFPGTMIQIRLLIRLDEFYTMDGE